MQRNRRDFDDGNAIDGDGCSNTCQVEEGYQCFVPSRAYAVIPACETTAQGCPTLEFVAIEGGSLKWGLTIFNQVKRPHTQLQSPTSASSKAKSPWLSTAAV